MSLISLNIRTEGENKKNHISKERTSVISLSSIILSDSDVNRQLHEKHIIELIKASSFLLH